MALIYRTREISTVVSFVKESVILLPDNQTISFEIASGYHRLVIFRVECTLHLLAWLKEERAKTDVIEHFPALVNIVGKINLNLKWHKE